MIDYSEGFVFTIVTISEYNQTAPLDVTEIDLRRQGRFYKLRSTAFVGSGINKGARILHKSRDLKKSRTRHNFLGFSKFNTVEQA
jgi:hypothetical protein